MGTLLKMSANFALPTQSYLSYLERNMLAQVVQKQVWRIWVMWPRVRESIETIIEEISTLLWRLCRSIREELIVMFPRQLNHDLPRRKSCCNIHFLITRDFDNKRRIPPYNSHHKVCYDIILVENICMVVSWIDCSSQQGYPGLKYRVSSKSVSTFVFWISRLPMGLEIPSLTFSHSPFCVDVKNIHFFYCLMKSEPRNW